MTFDRNDFQDLIVAQIPRLRRYAYGLTGNRAQGDDLVQECLERAWSRRRLYDPSRPVRPWLFTILHNLHVNQVRRRSAEVVTVSDATPGLPEAVAPAEAGAVDLDDLRRALSSLSPDHREVLLLVGLEQLSYRETADTLGIPVGTVMSRLARAREQLRTSLAGDGTRLRRVK